MKHFSLLHSRVGSLAQRLMVMFCVLMLGVIQVWGADAVYKETIFSSSNNSQGVSSYSNSWSNTTDNFQVDIANANNNNNGWAYVKMGSKNNAYVGKFTTHSAIDLKITKVSMNIAAVTSNNINSIKLYTSSNGSTWTERGSFTVGTGWKDVSIAAANQAKNLYYKIEVDCKKSSNGTIQINGLKFYAAAYTVSSVVSPSGKATVTLGTTTVFQGKTTTATYSGITSGYEFVNWSVSGTGASLSSTSATTTTITVGSADVTVTANLQCKTPTISSNLSTTQVDYEQNATAAALSVTAAAGGATLSYTWEKSSNGSTGWTSVGTNNKSYTPSTEVAGDLYYRCTVTNAATGCSTSATSKIAHIHVNEAVACTATPTVGVGSLNGSFSLTQVGVQCASSGAGDNCAITEYGWVWSDGETNTDPEINGAGVTNSPKTSGAPTGTGGSFTGTLSGEFAVGHTYYYKAYVTNGKPATTYSSVQTFTPRSVTFDLNGHGTSAPATQYVNNGGKATNPNYSESVTGYTFGGWYDNADWTQGTEWNFTSSTVSGGNQVLYAKWTTNKHTLTWSKNGGDDLTGSYTSGDNIEYGASITAPNTPTRTGYDFAGWHNGTAVVTPLTTMPDYNLTYTAQWTALEYDITYKDQGDVAYSGSNGSSLPAKHTYGTATNLVDGSKTGYTFGGWYTNQNCTGDAVTSLGETAYTAGMTLYAKWTANTYKVVFKANGGTGEDVEQTGFTYDQSKTLTSFESIGFTAPLHKYFLGWSKSNSATEPTYGDEESVSNLTASNSVDLYAVWKDYTYTNYRIICCTKHDVTLADEDGETEEGEWIVVPDRACEDKDVALDAEAKTGYEFAAWEVTKTSDESDITDAVIKSGSSKTNAEATIVMPDYGITVNATFSPLEYNITYKDKGDVAFSGTHETGYPTTHTYNAATTLKGATKTDWNFIGWYTDPDCTAGNEISTIAANSITADITLYAKWVEDNKWVVTISAPTNGGISVTYDGMESPLTSGSREILKNTEITITATGSTGYDCTGLTVNGVAFTSGTSMTLGSAITIAATFELHTYSITYNLDGGNNNVGNPANYQYTSSDITLLDPTKTGYTFKGWFNNSDLAEEHKVTGVAIATGSAADKEFWAKWEINEYTLTWNLAGGKVKTAGTHAAVDAEGTPSGKVEYNADITAPVVEKTGYDFTSWSEDVPEKMPAGDKTYTAQWTIINYEVHWWVNGHEWTEKGGSTNADYNTKVILPTAPTKADGCGDKFVGWTTSEYEHSTEAPGVLFKTQEDSPAITGVTNFYAVFADYGE